MPSIINFSFHSPSSPSIYTRSSSYFTTIHFVFQTATTILCFFMYFNQFRVGRANERVTKCRARVAIAMKNERKKIDMHTNIEHMCWMPKNMKCFSIFQKIIRATAEELWKFYISLLTIGQQLTFHHSIVCQTLKCRRSEMRSKKGPLHSQF